MNSFSFRFLSLDLAIMDLFQAEPGTGGKEANSDPRLGGRVAAGIHGAPAAYAPEKGLGPSTFVEDPPQLAGTAHPWRFV